MPSAAPPIAPSIRPSRANSAIFMVVLVPRVRDAPSVVGGRRGRFMAGIAVSASLGAFTARTRLSIVPRNRPRSRTIRIDQGGIRVKSIIHATGSSLLLGLLLTFSQLSLKAYAHTPQQPPHQLYSEG